METQHACACACVCVCLCLHVAYPYEFPSELHAYLSLWLSSRKCRVLSYLTFSGFISISVARNSRTNSHRGQTAIIKFPKVNGLTWHSESLTYLIPCIFRVSISLTHTRSCWGARSRKRVTALDRHPEIKANGSDGGNVLCHLCGSGFCALSWSQVPPHGSFFLNRIKTHKTTSLNTIVSYL